MTRARESLDSADGLGSGSTAAIAGYVAALFVAELLLAQGGFIVGGISHLLLLLTLIAHYLTSGYAAYRAMLLALTLPSITRLVSLTVTMADIHQLLWLVMIGVPTFLALFLVLRVVPTKLGSLLRVPSDVPMQILVAVSGLVHGLLLYLVLRPAAPAPITEPVAAVVVAVPVLLLFVAVLEEVTFRGVIQSVAFEITGSRIAAVSIAAVVYACMFVSADSPIVPLAMLAIGLLFGATVAYTGSLWGVMGAHALMTIGLLIAWPAVLR